MRRPRVTQETAAGERNVANCVTQTRSSENGVTDYYLAEVSWVSREMVQLALASL